jgi:phage terminase small subunit
VSLNNRQQAFIREYTRDFNATRAAKAVGYSEKTAYSSGQRLLKDVEIAEAVKAHIEDMTMPEDEVKLRLADIARGDMADFFDITPQGWNIRLIDRDGKPIPQTKLIKKIKQKVTTRLAKDESGEDSETIETELELYSAHDALRDIGKMYALFVDRTEGKLETEIIVKRVKGVSLDDL